MASIILRYRLRQIDSAADLSSPCCSAVTARRAETKKKVSTKHTFPSLEYFISCRYWADRHMVGVVEGGEKNKSKQIYLCMYVSSILYTVLTFLLLEV